MPASLYLPVYLTITTILAFLTAFRYIGSKGYTLQQQRTDFLTPLILCCILIVWLGNRPVSGSYFGDMSTYNAQYLIIGKNEITISWEQEWIWTAIAWVCSHIGLSNHEYFTVIEAGYVLFELWAVKKFTPTNPMLAMIFVFTSLMFFTFGTNGLRNGLACHIMLLGIALLLEGKNLLGSILFLIAFGVHRSVILPIGSLATALFFIKNYKIILLIWIGSIGLSLVIGNSFANMMGSLGFDDRMTSYMTHEYDSSFSRVGFRWDFLLYSSFPILMAWFVLIKKGIKDRWYEIICIVYTLSNAFWVMVIRAAFSNRFAYLSWFLYPVVIVYPLINLPIWEDQDKKTGMILLANSGFTLFMQSIYW